MRKIVIVSLAAGVLALAGCKNEPVADAEQAAEVDGEEDDATAAAPSDVIETEENATGEKAE